MINQVSDFKDRLEEALNIRNITPAELSKRTQISESTISQYRSGYAKPKDKKLVILSNALNVNPTWLMGLDVPMEIPTFTVPWTGHGPKYKIIVTEEENNLINTYRKADEIDRRSVQRILGIDTVVKKDSLDA